MYAFGLEECNRLDEAEAAARKGLALDRNDPWAHHAIAHCLEARGRMLEGVAFLNSVSDTWGDCNSFMQTHNWWHLALFLIDLDRTDEALALYDERVWGVWKEFCEDQANAVSLLARLELRGVDVGERWADLATYLKPRLHEHLSAFLDVHYLYGLARAGERSAVTEMLASLEDRAERAKPFEREAWADCVVPLAHGLAAHAAGDMPAAARLIGQAMPHLRTARRLHRAARAVRRHPPRCPDPRRLERRGAGDPAGRRARAADRGRDQARAGRSLSQGRPHRAGAGRRIPGRTARPPVSRRPRPTTGEAA